MTKIDSALQAQVDAQLLEQGAFTVLELLLASGRLAYSDYESWRRREIEFLDSAFMGSAEKIRVQIEQAANYARSIGLVEQPQEFHAWQTEGAANGKPLRISEQQPVHRLIAGRYIPAQAAPQMDLFFDNPVAALTNGIAKSLAARNLADAQRQLDRLYEISPTHADLAGFDRLLATLQRLEHPCGEAREELDFLLESAPTAKRLLGSQWRDLLTPLWRRLGDSLVDVPYSADQPQLHRTFALSQAQDWPGVSECVQRETGWWLHAPLCVLLFQSYAYQNRRVDALSGWFQLCWHSPAQVADAVSKQKQPDAGITTVWREFLATEDDLGDDDADESGLTPTDFPAWMLLHERGLAQQLSADLPQTKTPGEEIYRCVHAWIEARRAQKKEDELALRKQLQAKQPMLFRYLKTVVG